MGKSSPKVLVHACCAVCLGYPYEMLSVNGYDISVLFYNPNIFPKEEYERRKREVIRFCADKETELKIIEDDAKVFYDLVKGYENEPERGMRCEQCFELRLDKAAWQAKQIGAEYFTTTLSVSPHKSFQQIKGVAERVGQKYGVKFLEIDFKKRGGFMKTNEIAAKYDFYRQKYCGCEFSIRNSQ